jgi:hypothetical protein
MDANRLAYIETCKNNVAHLLENNKVLIHYTRDFRGNRTGVLVAAVLPNETVPSYGWSVCHPKKDRFNKYIGICKAVERMTLGSPAAEDGSLLLPNTILEALPEFENRVARYFKMEPVTNESEN